MRILQAVLIGLTLSIVSVGCEDVTGLGLGDLGNPLAGPPPSPVMNWEGRVTSSVDGSSIGLIDVTVLLLNDDGSFRQVASTITRIDGFYELGMYACPSSVHDFDYFIQACSSDSPYGTCVDWEESERVPTWCEAGESRVQHIDFVLDPIAP